MKEKHTHWLRLQCEYWLEEQLPDVFGMSYKRMDEALVAGSERLISRLGVSVGPWDNVCFCFKSPGESVAPEEKTALAALREQDCLVLIVRCFEDFRMMAQTYFAPYLSSKTQLVPKYEFSSEVRAQRSEL